MKTWLLIAAALLSVSASARADSPATPDTVSAQSSPGQFSPSQRQEIIRIVRDALKADPSILRDAVETLQASDEAMSQADTKKALATHRQVLLANAGDPVAGNPKGDVTLVEFYDPRCPYCKRMLPAIDAMLAKDPGLRVVYKDIPVLGPVSVSASRAILAAQSQGAYLKMQAAIMSSPAQPTIDMIKQTAGKLGLDTAKLMADMNGEPVSQRIQGNLLLAKSLKVQGTPVFIVGDQLIPGAVDQPQLEAAIATARKHPTD